jgi:peptide/nickel transport system substrate-binding protein
MIAITRLFRLIAIGIVSISLPSVLAYAGARPAPTAAPGKPAGTVTVAIHTFSKERTDPSMDTTLALPYHGQMYDWFIGATPVGQLTTAYGALDNYEANANATVYTFTLRKGLKWHDGVEMTAEDIKFTVEHYARKESTCTQCGVVKANLDQVEVVDRQTVRIHLKKPDANLPAAFGPLEGDIKILPKHYIAKVGLEAFEQKPVGSGPWKFVRREIGQFIEYEANTNYWNPSRIPGFAKLRVLLVPEARTRVAMLKRGEADLVNLEPQDVKPLRSEGFTILGPRNAGSSLVVFWKSYDPAFLCQKLEFRKALTLAVDWEAVVNAFYPPEVGERHRGGAALFSPVTMGYDAELPPYTHNPEEAKRLLQQAGYKGEKVNFWSYAETPNPEQLEVNEVIASYWRKVGLEVNLIPVDFATFRPKYATRPQKFDPPCEVAVSFPWMRPSLVNNMRVYMVTAEAGGVISGYWDSQKADRLFAEVSAIVDPQARDRRLRELNREFYQEYWAIPIVVRHLPFAAGPRIADWQPTSATPTNLAFETLKPRR